MEATSAGGWERSTDAITSFCMDLEARKVLDRVRPEDPKLNSEVLSPMASFLGDYESFPELPPGPSASVARSVWVSLHPESDLVPVLDSLADRRAAVRFAGVLALRSALEANSQQWRQPPFPAQALQALQQCREKEKSRTISLMLQEVIDAAAKLARPPRRPRSPVRANPYVAGMPVRDADKFFGRKDVLQQIGNTLGKRPGVKSFVIYGARRSGKTSVLLRIKGGVLGAGFLPVYVDMQGFAGVDANVFLSSMAKAAASGATEAGIEFDAEPLPPPDDPGLRPAVQAMIKAITDATKLNVLFLIDEHEILLEYVKKDPTVALQVQHLVEDRGNLFFIFAGSHALESIGKKSSLPLLDAATYAKITFLTRAEALDLVRKPAQRSIQYDDGVPEKLVDLTNGHPFYLQLLCQTLFETAASGDRVVTEAMLADAVAAFQRDPAPHVVLTWNGFKLEEKVAGSTLAALGGSASPEEIRDRLKSEEYPSVPNTAGIRKGMAELCEVGWVEEDSSRGIYRFTMELVRQWVAATRSIKALADEQWSTLQERTAPPWRQLLAELMDAVLATIVLLAGVVVAVAFKDKDLEWLWVVIAVLGVVLFICPMAVGRFTVGLRLWNLYPVTRTLNPLSNARAAAFGILLLLRAGILIGSVIAFVAAGWQAQTEPAWWAAAGAGILLIAADILIMLTTKGRRGIIDRLAGVQLMYRK